MGNYTMDKTTLKVIGARLKREFAAIEQLPFPLQQALAELAAREEGRPQAEGDGESEPDPASQKKGCADQRERTAHRPRSC